MKQRRQHHVWQHYLKSWTVDGQLYCLRDRAIFPTGTHSVAVDRDFYKLHRLTDDDLTLIKRLAIDVGHPLAKRHHEDLLVRLAGPVRFVEENRHRLANLEKIEELLDVHQTNALEDYHAGVENRFLPLLDMILAGDLSFYENDAQCITFFHFVVAISMQDMQAVASEISASTGGVCLRTEAMMAMVKDRRKFDHCIFGRSGTLGLDF